MRNRIEERFKILFEYLPIAIWEEDCSSLGHLLMRLRGQGVEDIRKYLLNHSGMVLEAFRKIKVLDVNKAALALYGAKNKKELIAYAGRVLGKDSIKVLVDELVALAKGDRFFTAELKSKTLQGRTCDISFRVSVPAGYGKNLSRVIITFENITERKRLERRFKTMAQLDSLTKIYNQKAISQRLKEEFIRAKRYHSDFSCLMIDLDYFKVVNDKFGHQKGDQILRRVADLLKKGLRKTDIIGRYGGDEFFVILTETKLANAKIAAQRIQKYVSTHIMKFVKDLPVRITLSIGISGYPAESIKDYKSLITQADKALYLAKASGRDYVQEPR